MCFFVLHRLSKIIKFILNDDWFYLRDRNIMLFDPSNHSCSLKVLLSRLPDTCHLSGVREKSSLTSLYSKSERNILFVCTENQKSAFLYLCVNICRVLSLHQIKIPIRYKYLEIVGKYSPSVYWSSLTESQGYDSTAGVTHLFHFAELLLHLMVNSLRLHQLLLNKSATNRKSVVRVHTSKQEVSPTCAHKQTGSTL